MFETRYGGHATEIARDNVWRFSAIVSIGGDGTLHEIINGLLLGYLIDKTSWALAFESGTASLQNPYSGPNPMFVLRDNDPAVDGFLVSTSVDFPQGVPLAIAGIFGPFDFLSSS